MTDGKTRPAARIATVEAESPELEAWCMFRRNIPVMFGLVILSAIVMAGFYGAVFYQGDAFDIVWAPHGPPGVTPGFPMGTDYLGWDIAAGLLTGGAPTLAVGASTAAITMVIGLSLGALAGYFCAWAWQRSRCGSGGAISS